MSFAALAGLGCGLDTPEKCPWLGREASTLAEAHPDGWWYSAPLPGSWVLVAWMSEGDLVRQSRLCETERWLPHLEESQWTRERTSGPLLVETRVRDSQSLCAAFGAGRPVE